MMSDLKQRNKPVYGLAKGMLRVVLFNGLVLTRACTKVIRAKAEEDLPNTNANGAVITIP